MRRVWPVAGSAASDQAMFGLEERPDLVFVCEAGESLDPITSAVSVEARMQVRPALDIPSWSAGMIPLPPPGPPPPLSAEEAQEQQRASQEKKRIQAPATVASTTTSSSIDRRQNMIQLSSPPVSQSAPPTVIPLPPPVVEARPSTLFPSLPSPPPQPPPFDAPGAFPSPTAPQPPSTLAYSDDEIDEWDDDEYEDTVVQDKGQPPSTQPSPIKHANANKVQPSPPPPPPPPALSPKLDQRVPSPSHEQPFIPSMPPPPPSSSPPPPPQPPNASTMSNRQRQRQPSGPKPPQPELDAPPVAGVARPARLPTKVDSTTQQQPPPPRQQRQTPDAAAMPKREPRKLVLVGAQEMDEAVRRTVVLDTAPKPVKSVHSGRNLVLEEPVDVPRASSSPSSKTTTTAPHLGHSFFQIGKPIRASCATLI